MFRHFKKLYFDVYFTARFFFSFDKSCEHEQCISSSNPEGRCKSFNINHQGKQEKKTRMLSQALKRKTKHLFNMQSQCGETS